MTDETEPTGATPEGSQPASGATPGSDGKGATPDTPLGDNGKAALDKEREARRDAERNAAQLRDRIAELEDAGKPELDRLGAQLKRATDDLSKRDTRIAELEGELSRRDMDELRRQAAEAEGLPLSAAKRLQGANLTELKADARSLRGELFPEGDLGGGRGGTAAGKGRGTDMNAMIREAAGRG